MGNDEKRNEETRSSNTPADTTQASDTEEATDAANIEHPTGLKLASIILALMLGIFLASLDMVNHETNTTNITNLLTPSVPPDNCGDSHPQDYR